MNEYKSHDSCGTGFTVAIKGAKQAKIVKSKTPVVEGLDFLACMEYRSGYNLITQENDGAGIRLYGLPTKFFQKKFKIELEDNKYAIGQYFLSKENLDDEKKLIEEKAKENGLKVAGWRNVASEVDKSAISESALAKMPEIWQAVLVEDISLQVEGSIEEKASKAAVEVINTSMENPEKFGKIHIASQSSRSVVYKGMVRPNEMKAFFAKELLDPDFEVESVQVHSRMATNTSPQWANAQPCVFFIAHNGELNSALANSYDMKQEMNLDGVGVIPNSKLSDSMQFDADLMSQVLRGRSLKEAFAILMAPNFNEKDYDEKDRAGIKDMIEYFRLQRTPYNGPAFMVAGHDGEFIARLDTVGLRPARYAIIENEDGSRLLHAYSDDVVDYRQLEAGQKLIAKGVVEPGGFLMVDKDGKILKTKEVLQEIHKESVAKNGENYFSDKLKENVKSLEDFKESSAQDQQEEQEGSLKNQLNRKLYSSFWDYESVQDIVGSMALEGKERVYAMGNDVSLFPTLSEEIGKGGISAHISAFFHQLFAQVSAPPLDSIKERASFNLKVNLGGHILSQSPRQIKIESPILQEDELRKILTQEHVETYVIDGTFKIDKANPQGAYQAMQNALKEILAKAVEVAKKGGIIVLSDAKASDGKVAIPDMILAAAVKKHLVKEKLDRNVSIVCDSRQIVGPHQAAALLSVGVNAVYARGAYEKIADMNAHDPQFSGAKDKYYRNYQGAMQASLLKIMGKMGITDVNNYSGGKLLASIGLNFSDQKESQDDISLSNLFGEFYSPFKGANMRHIVNSAVARSIDAYNEEHNLALLPHFGRFRPESGGVKHGYGPEVVNAFTDWLNEEQIRHDIFRIDQFLSAKGKKGFAKGEVGQGFLHDGLKDEKGFYKQEVIDAFEQSKYFKEYVDKVQEYRAKNPTSISDIFEVAQESRAKKELVGELQSKSDIMSTLFCGSMSQGALSTGFDPENDSEIRAHETITRGMNAIGANSASGEGGSYWGHLSDPLKNSKSHQVASGRFGNSAKQISGAIEIEIKMAQGAKPGEGGQLPGYKVSIRFASQRGSIPGVDLISPPPHHDIYSIEDLSQLIHDIKSVNPNVSVTVKLVASQGIGDIAVGVAKAGADVINVAGNSGGTGAAMQTSIKQAGMSSELGVALVDTALRKAKLRGQVKLRTSGGFKTPEDVIKAAIFGADLFEFGTTAMLTVGCKMQRTCNKSCEPGITADGEKFQGQQRNVELFFANIAAGVQERLKQLGVNNLAELRGRTDLIKFIDEDKWKDFDFSMITQEKPEIIPVKEEFPQLLKRKDDEFIEEIIEKFNQQDEILINDVELSPKDRSFGARLSGRFNEALEGVKTLEKDRSQEVYKKTKRGKKIIVKSRGIAGQSYGFVNCEGLILEHEGSVLDGAGKSMTGGEIILRTPNIPNYQAQDNIIAGNVAFFGASGGKGYINGRVGNRFGVLLKGAQVVCEGAGDYALEYMTSGTAMILGDVGRDLGAGAFGGIIFAYDKSLDLQNRVSDSVRLNQENKPYQKAIIAMLQEHFEKTGSRIARQILEQNPEQILNQFKVIIPKNLDKITNLSQLNNILEAYNLRHSEMSIGMKVWFEEKAKEILENVNLNDPYEFTQLRRLNQVITQKKSRVEEQISKEAIQILAAKLDDKLVDVIKSITNIAQFDNLFRNKLLGFESLSIDVTKVIRSKFEDLKADFNQEDLKNLYLTVIQSGEEFDKAGLGILKALITSFAKTNLSKELQEEVEKYKTASDGIEDIQLSPPNYQAKSVKERISAGAKGTLDKEFLPILENILQHIGKVVEHAKGCSGCGAQSCSAPSASTGCPEEKPINNINAVLQRIGNIENDLSPQQWRALREAFELQIQATPFIAYTGAACPAPCEVGCTENLPEGISYQDAKRGGKLRGEPVQIKAIEYNLFRLGDYLGWFDDKKKEFSESQVKGLFGSKEKREAYEQEIKDFDPPFKKPKEVLVGEKLIIVGSGPAAMEIAYKALKRGIKNVEMYEKSDKPGGVLMDGIPAHKFEKSFIFQDFERLKEMGLKLHLNSEVLYDKEKDGGGLFVGDKKIASENSRNEKVAICVGAGKPRKLDSEVTKNLGEEVKKKKIFQAVDFLKIANNIALQIQEFESKLNLLLQERLALASDFTDKQKEELIAIKDKHVNEHKNFLIRQEMGDMDIRGKKVAIIGGGDTAQDNIRWAIKYLQEQGNPKGCLEILVRGPQKTLKAGQYPHPSPEKQSPENTLMQEEVDFIGASAKYLTQPTEINLVDDKLVINVNRSEFEYYDDIKDNKDIKSLYDSLPRGKKPTKLKEQGQIEADIIFCALGFEGQARGDSFVSTTNTNGANNFYVAGDAATKPESWIIVAAQKSGADTFDNKIFPDMINLQSEPPVASPQVPRLYQKQGHVVSI